MLAVAVGLFLAYNQLKSAPGGASAPASAGAAQEADSAADNGPVAAVSGPSEDELLAPMLAEINAALTGFGVTVSIDDIRKDFQETNRMVPLSDLRRMGKKAGLSAPELRRFDSTDKTEAKGAYYKCVVNGETQYLDSLPSPDKGASECWASLMGDRSFSYTDPRDLVTYTRVERKADLNIWERQFWQPHNGRWATYDESGEMQVLRYLIDSKYGLDAEQKDRELSQTILNRSLKNPNLSPHAMGSGVLLGFKTRILRSGAQRRLEVMNSW